MYYAVVGQQLTGSVSSQVGDGLHKSKYSPINARGGRQRCSCVVACSQSKRQEISDTLTKSTVAAALCLATFLNASSPVLAADEPFLKRTGARGILQQEEEKLYRMRQSAEEEAREELAEVRSEFEQEAKKTYDGKLCATPFGVDVVGITEAIALTGALVGGISARRRKDELEKLNDQLRTINSQLRQQARAGTLYAPGLTYAPTTTQGVAGTRATPSATKVSIPTGAVNGMGGQVVKKPQNVTETPNANGAMSSSPSSNNNTNNNAVVSLASLDEEDLRPEIKQCQAALKEGKRLLKEQDAGPAMVRFEKALMLARSMGDKVRERRAVRGLAASNRILGRYQQAIDYLGKVLEISEETGDHVGDVDAYGTIADIYTEMGEFEKAAEYYDLYIGKMTIEGPV